MSLDPQLEAADPDLNIFLAANAGTGKTRTLVSRVARLLLRGARPEAVLCITYTKAAAAEMQRRLFTTLGDWAVMDDRRLAAELAALEEPVTDLSRARRLFALALETPGGLKVQTVHAFCERLLRRFPLEAGVSPRFTVLEDASALTVSARARDAVARAALAGAGAIADAYARMSISLDPRSFDGMFGCFDSERDAVAAYVELCGGEAGVPADVWRRCGFSDGPRPVAAIEAEAVSATGASLWRRAAGVLREGGGKQDGDCALKLLAVAGLIEAGEPAYAAALDALFTSGGEGTPRTLFAKSKALKAAGLCEPMVEEQDRFDAARAAIRGALVAEDTVATLTLAQAYAAVYAESKAQRGALDFADLIARTKELLTVRADAAWVLFKLDGGIDHILVDEAQDTAPEQWDIVRALAAEFFAGASVERKPSLVAPLDRTLFAVGDEKQSIYSFQGARPERLLQESRAYDILVNAADREFKTPELHKSWRSTPEVLAFVDAVFRDPLAKAGVRPRVPGDPPAAEQSDVEHSTVRSGEAGCVDLWPLIPELSVEDPDPWLPLDVEAAGSGRKRLADAIADGIRAAVLRGESVGLKDGPRPVGYGDFLVLVQRRDATFEEIIRACKLKGVPVAGADRLVLSAHIAFQDLLALVRFVLFPGDDLTLAVLLRSAFCDVDEDGLYALAQGRGKQRLWRVLRDRAGERPEWTAAADLLGWAIREAGRAPFDFLARALERPDAGGRSMRARFLTRLGAEARDALDETLAQALAAESRGVHDLESFAAAVAEADVQVKRELEEPRGEVRVMTVHGAKGLEAPIVILPDTTSKPRVDGPALLKTEDGAFLWCSSKKADCEPSEAARLRREEAKRQESMRLLYVALTRARDRLILCGRLDKTQSRSGLPAEGSWYALAETAFARPEICGEVRSLDGGVRRYGPDPVLITAAVTAETDAAVAAPAWLAGPAAREARQDFASAGRMARRGGGAPSPLSGQGDLGRFRRGELIHKLLEVLPDLPPAQRRSAADVYLAKQGGLDDAVRAEMSGAALAVLESPDFAPVFGPGSRAEAALAGAIPGLSPVSGRVDRLVVTPDRVLVVDFKTNRTAPAAIEAADPAYLDQMATYTALLRAIFPGREVQAALLWTDGPRLMPVPTALIDARLALLRQGRAID